MQIVLILPKLVTLLSFNIAFSVHCNWQINKVIQIQTTLDVGMFDTYMMLQVIDH